MYTNDIKCFYLSKKEKKYAFCYNESPMFYIKKRYKYAQDYFKGEYDDEKIYYDRIGFVGNDDPKCL